MTYNELNEMTVLQLRKLAKEHAVVLGAGIDKAGIIQKLLSVLPEQDLWLCGAESGKPDKRSGFKPLPDAAERSVDQPVSADQYQKIYRHHRTNGCQGYYDRTAEPERLPASPC